MTDFLDVDELFESNLKIPNKSILDTDEGIIIKTDNKANNQRLSYYKPIKNKHHTILS